MAARMRRRLRRRQPRLEIPRPVLDEEYNDVDFFERYRFRQRTVRYLVELSGDTLNYETNRNRPLSAFLQICITLRYLAGAGIQQICADCLDVATSTVCRTIWRVIEFLIAPRISGRFIRFPANTDRLKQEFHALANFPNVVGAIDGTQIAIQKPSDNTQEYMNRKGFASINVQIICDHRFRIMDCVARWPGSAHDSRIFRNSQVCRDFDNGRVDGILLGDSGYPTKRYLMTPFLNPAQPHHVRFNNAHARTRVVIEQTFGIIKRRFGILGQKMQLIPVKACKVVVACATLNVIGIEEGDIIPYQGEDVPFNPDDHMQQAVLNEQEDGQGIREFIARSYFM